MCPAAPVTATLIGVFMAQLAINVPLSNGEANNISSQAKSPAKPYLYAKAGEIPQHYQKRLPGILRLRLAPLRMTRNKLCGNFSSDVPDEIRQDHQSF